MDAVDQEGATRPGIGTADVPPREPEAASTPPGLAAAPAGNTPRRKQATQREEGSRHVAHVASEHLPRARHAVKKVSPRARKKTGEKRKRTPIRVGGHRVEKGTHENVLLKISEHYTHQGVYIPVTVVRGARSGPRLFLTAAIHGDEVNGVQIVREILNHIDPKHLRGTLVAAPVVNRFGFVAHTRYMPDRRDLNRSFPGDPNGSTTARVAHIVFEEIVRPCDYGIDLHTAGYQRTNLPQVRADMSNDRVRKIAKAFGAEVILDNPGLKGTLRRTATEDDIATIIYEAGETFRFQRDMIQKGVFGILNVMRNLRMLPGKPVAPEYQIIVKTSEWVRASHGGILETLVLAGHIVYEGDVIARIANPFGRTVDEVKAPFDGLVVGAAMLPMVNPGAPICHLVKLKKTLKTVRGHHDRFTPPPLPERLIQEHFEPEEGPPGPGEEDIEG